MTLKEEVNEILKYDIREIIASPLIVKLLSLYSKLYLNGGQPSSCEKCIKKYYQEIIQNGIKKAEIMEEIKKRTCVPNWNGLMYIQKAARHFNDKLITDEQAINFLERGILEEKNFKTLPAGYKKMTEKEIIDDLVKPQAISVPQEEVKPKAKKTAAKK